MKLSLVVHAHQPPGNFDSVFREGLDRCYGPFLDLLEEFEHVRMSLHFSGSLLEWIERNAPDRVAQLRRLVERGQVEPVAAGLYEPVLALLPPQDRVGQLRAHRAKLRALLGADTHVGWLTERVWEPSMVTALRAGGIDVVTLDERHFLSAGLATADLTGAFTTEYQGETLTIVPGSEALRMAIPWRSVRDTIALIRQMAADGVEHAVFGDDMEKFGMWPGTYRSVIQGGWLRRFYRELARLGDEVELVPLGEAAARPAGTPPPPRVYIPDGSYPEMLAWSLPPARQRQLKSLQERLRRARLLDTTAPFMRAGIYYQFLAKYPEANHLHKRMLDVSHRIAARVGRAPLADDAPETEIPGAVRDLWRAQANDSYWHGWFGGVYLPLLRRDPWRSLLRAEHALAALGERPRALRVFDLDADGADEAVLTNDTLTAVVDPDDGGAVVELSDRTRAINLADTLARRPEAYHPVGRQAPPYDRGRRSMFLDRFLPPGPPPRRSAEIADRGDFCDGAYTLTAARNTRGGARVALDRTGAAPGGTARVRKTVTLAPAGGSLEARYRVEAVDGRVTARFGVELNFGVYFQQVTRGHVVLGGRWLDLRRGGAERNATRCTVALENPDVAAHLESSEPPDIDVRSFSTVSQSEHGLERSPQALACLLTWPVDLDPGERFEVTLRLSVDGGDGGAR